MNRYIEHKVFSVTGHRPDKFAWRYNENDSRFSTFRNILKQELLKTVERGFDYFISGMALGVDTWAVECLLEIKHTHPNIIIEAAVPCLGQHSTWTIPSRIRYLNLLKKVDIVTYVSNLAYNENLNQMKDRNIYMVDRSKLVIAVYNGTHGGTQHCYDYAAKSGIEIVCIHPNTFEINTIETRKGN